MLLMSDYIRDVKASRSKFWPRPLLCMLGLSLEHLASFTITGIHHIHACTELALAVSDGTTGTSTVGVTVCRQDCKMENKCLNVNS